MCPEDRLPRLRSKCQDYLRMGVPVVWIFDPQQETAYVMRKGEFVEVKQGVLRLEDMPIELDVQQIFATAKKHGRRG